MVKKVNADVAKTKREVYGRDLYFLNFNKDKYDLDEEEDLNDTISQNRLRPNILTEFPGMPLESD